MPKIGTYLNRTKYRRHGRNNSNKYLSRLILLKTLLAGAYFKSHHSPSMTPENPAAQTE